MKDRNVIENSILLELMKSSGSLDTFSLFRRLKISFPFFFKALNSLKEKKLIEIEDSKVSIGKNAWEEYEKFVRHFSSQRTENSKISRFAPSRMVPGQPYIPCIKRLDRKKFPVS